MRRRLFVGIDFSSPTKKLIGTIQKQLAPVVSGVKWEREEKYHLTLSFLGSTAVEPAKILEALTKKLAHVERFAISFGELGVLQGKLSILMLEIKKSAPLVRLYHQVSNELESLSFPRTKSFHPHVTLGRSKQLHFEVPQLQLDQQVLVTEVTLFESTLGVLGSSYRVLGQVKLLPNLSS